MRIKLTLFALSALVVVACHTSKKSTTSTTSATTSTNTTNTVAATTTVVETPVVAVTKARKALDGVYEPGEEELTAIQPQYKDATLEQLKEGYTLYAKSACISCHRALNIYIMREEKWPFILQDMAYRAKLTQTQKEAVLRYVYAVKAADPDK
jgi:hypothetical protein